jgi:hypothetical protein
VLPGLIGLTELCAGLHGDGPFGSDESGKFRPAQDDWWLRKDAPQSRTDPDVRGGLSRADSRDVRVRSRFR